MGQRIFSRSVSRFWRWRIRFCWWHLKPLFLVFGCLIERSDQTILLRRCMWCQIAEVEFNAEAQDDNDETQQAELKNKTLTSPRIEDEQT
jgi:hypothetical protein